mgnify:FL=1
MRFLLIVLLLMILMGIGPVIKALGILALIIIGLPVACLFLLVLLMGILGS